MLTILMGRAKSGKSERILSEIRRLGDTGRQILLVPEHASHAAEVDLCACCGDTASRHAEVLSFRRLASRALAVTGGLSDVTLDAGGKLLTLQKALSETAPALKLYRRPSRRPEFLRELLSLFDELISYQVTPELLAEKAADMTGATREKLEDLSLLYGAYLARLFRPGADARDRMSKLCDQLEPSGYIDGKDIFLDGFSYFTGQEMKVLSVLLRRAHSVTVTLLGEDGGRNELFGASLRTREALLRLAAEEGCPSAVRTLPSAPPRCPLEYLERGFFGSDEPWEGQAGEIRVREAATVFSETEQTAAEIRRLVSSGECRYRDITVAVRNLDDYADAIQNIFERYEIPVYLSRRSDILETPALTAITGALDAVTGGEEYEDVFRYLKTGLAGLAPEECDRLENYCLTWEIHGAMWLSDTPWTANPGGYGAPWTDAQTRDLEEINALRLRVKEPLSLLSEGLKAAETADGKVEALYSFLERLHLQEALEEQMHRLAEEGQLQRAEETAQLWEILCGVLDQFVEILRGEAMDSQEFVRLFRQIVTQYSVGTIPVSLDQVTVSEITRNDRHTVRYLFLMGANDHVLPSPGTGGGILNDDDRDELSSRGVRLAPRGMEQMSLELQNLYAALAQPTSGLTVSYPVGDVSGAELRPAFVTARIFRLFPSVRLEHESIDKEYRLTASIPALETAGQRPGGALWRYFASRPERAGQLRAMERAALARRGRLSHPAVETLYGTRLALSASRVEKLNSCHFAYFMEYGLRARERAPAAFDAPQIGTLLHYILENVTREAMARGGFRETADGELKALTERYLDEYAQREYPNFRDRSPRFRYLFSRLRQAAWSVVRETAEELRSSDFVPLAFELSFGDRGQLGAVTITEPDGELRLGGKVDRVDGWLKDGRLYLRVVDYKTGKKSFDLAEVRMGLDLQMLVYLFALQREGSGYFGHPIEPAGVLYLPARDPVLPAERSVTPEKLRELREKTLRRSGLLLGEPEVLRAMEHSALTEPHYLPVRVGRDGSLSGSLATAAQLGKLSGYLGRLLEQIGGELLGGNIDADPCCRSEEDSFCRFCPWASACHFEDGRDGDHLHYITPVKTETFWQQVEESGKERGGHE
ncbi:MAG: PD-(D/E)XK nuclease family protein [Oscillibacter sp.]|jgi:ATP-dependent helicase/nuclease subunit B|nr:PD-(D/E)XK nuclease family protein [Oscillibacter sp.]